VNPIAAALVVAIVAQDPTPLRALPREGAPRVGQLAAGEWLEVRDERAGYLKVWDHRHERPGYVKATQVRVHRLDEAGAPALAAVISFLKDSSGSEALGIGYVAAFLKAAPASAVGPEVFDALGTFADRLARRASARRSASDETLAAHLDVAAEYGVRFATFEQGDRTRVCYDGEAFRRVLALGGVPQARARAALALTNPDCVDPSLQPTAELTLLEWQEGVLASVDASSEPGWLANRLRMRRAAVDSQLAFHWARRGEAKRSAQASAESIKALALVEKLELGDGDEDAYEETAVRVAASRWASEEISPLRGGLTLAVKPGSHPGESCLELSAAAGNPDAKPLAQQCTYSVPHPSSARASPDGRALAIAVQPLPGWLELWVFHKVGDAWEVQQLTPAPADPSLGYVELAGFSPDGAHLLVVREARVEKRIAREFQILSARTLAVEKHGGTFDGFGTFRKWHSAEWKEHTLALR